MLPSPRSIAASTAFRADGLSTAANWGKPVPANRITDGTERELHEDTLDRNREALIETVRGLFEADAPPKTRPVADDELRSELTIHMTDEAARPVGLVDFINRQIERNDARRIRPAPHDCQLERKRGVQATRTSIAPTLRDTTFVRFGQALPLEYVGPSA